MLAQKSDSHIQISGERGGGVAGCTAPPGGGLQRIDGLQHIEMSCVRLLRPLPLPIVVRFPCHVSCIRGPGLRTSDAPEAARASRSSSVRPSAARRGCYAPRGSEGPPDQSISWRSALPGSTQGGRIRCTAQVGIQPRSRGVAPVRWSTSNSP